LHPLVVHGPALSPEQAVGHAPAPSDVLRRDLAETVPELGLLQVDNLAAMTLGDAGCCGAGPLHGTPGAQMPGNAPAEQRQPCGDAPGSEVSLGKVLRLRRAYG
jgi:hypothetical protein